MKKLSLCLLICLGFPYSLCAQDVSRDTVIAWFRNYCNQNYQASALWTIYESIEEPGVIYPYGDYLGQPCKMVGVKSFYDTLTVRNAFKDFVWSITLADCTANCDTIVYSYSVSGIEDGGEGDDIWNEMSRQMVLSIYIWWGFTDSLYLIADKLYEGFPPRDAFYSMLWNKMGTGYFSYCLTKTEADTNYTTGVYIASAYLAYSESPEDSMVALAGEILSTAAYSDGILQRKRTAQLIIDPYLKGYANLKPLIDTLRVDNDEFTRNHINYEISKYQREKHLLMEFLKPED